MGMGISKKLKTRKRELSRARADLLKEQAADRRAEKERQRQNEFGRSLHAVLQSGGN